MKFSEYKNKVKISILAVSSVVLLTILRPAAVYAQEHGSDVTTDVLAAQTTKQKNELDLVLPEETDNPNYEIHFKDPSEDGEGVKLSIDGSSPEEVESPYALPALSIGRHKLVFSYTDKIGATQELTAEITIVPRPPVISIAKEFDRDTGWLTIHGSAIPLSQVEILMTGGQLHSPIEAIVEVGTDGKWNYTFETVLEEGRYTVVAQTKKQGFRSTLSKPLSFTVEAENQSGGTTEQSNPEESQPRFDLNDFRISSLKDFGNVNDLFVTNKDMNYVYGAILFVGILLGTFVSGFFSSRQYRKTSALLQNLLTRESEEDKESRVVASTLADKLKDARARQLTLRQRMEMTKDERAGEATEEKRESRSKKQVKNRDKASKKSVKSKVVKKKMSMKLDNSSSSKARKSRKAKSKTVPEKRAKKQGSARKGTRRKKKKGNGDSDGPVEVSKEKFLEEFKTYAPEEPEQTKGAKSQAKTEKDRNIRISLSSDSV